MNTSNKEPERIDLNVLARNPRNSHYIHINIYITITVGIQA